MEEWIEEFLFRGRPPSGPGSEMEPSFHVVIGRQAPSQVRAGEMDRGLVGPVPFAVAEDMGWPLEKIVAAMNAEAIKRCDALAAEVAAKDALLEEAADALKAATADAEEKGKEIADMAAAWSVLAERAHAQEAEIARLSTLASQQQAVIETISIAEAVAAQ